MLKAKVLVKRIVYPKTTQKSGDFTIFSVEIKEMIQGEKPKNNMYGTVTFKGVVPKIKEFTIYTMIFEELTTDKYGESCNVISVSKDFNPKNKIELLEYYKLLTSETISKRLIEIPEALEWIKTRDKEKLLTVKGLGEKAIDRLLETAGEFADNTEALVKLKPYGISEKLISKICARYGGSEGAIDVVLNEPYSLIGKIKGVGFLTVDDIAIKIGIDAFSPIRLKCALIHILETAGEEGKSYLNATQVYQEFRKLVSIDFSKLGEIVNELVSQELLIMSNDGNSIALPYYYNLEQSIAKELIRILGAKTHIEVDQKWRNVIEEIEKKQGWKHTEEQFKSIEMSLNSNIVVICGKAGTGKTTIVNAVSEILKDYQLTMCCLSAKASQRLKEVTGEEASTIHKLLGIGSMIEETSIYSDVVIVDEASMINGTIFLKLLQAIQNGTKIIILGDNGQLTSIGNCSVFSDLLKNKLIPVMHLTQIHRQAQKSAIITKSLAIRNQERICPKGFKGHTILGELQDLDLFVVEQEETLNLVKNQFLKQLQKTNNILEVQVISILKSRGILSTANLNRELQNLYIPNPSKEFFYGVDKIKIHLGDKVINTKNNYNVTTVEGEDIGVWNGSIGIVEAISEDEATINFQNIGRLVLLKKDLINLNLAYAITVHSSQGSQWQNVIFAFDMSAYILLNVEIVYTGLTRASKHCTLIVEPKAMSQARRTVEQNNKQTFLREII